MIRRILLTALMLIMVPAFAFAGSYSIAVSGAGGSVGPAPLSGYATAIKNFTATATATYTLSKVTRNGIDVTANTLYVNGTTITVPLSSASQTYYVTFKKSVQVTPTLSAVLPASITMPANTATPLSGGNSTIANLNTGTQATFTFASYSTAQYGGASLAFSPTSNQVTNPINISSNVTAPGSGTYKAHLTLTAPNATPSTANVIITVLAPGVIASNACLNCHTGWAEATAYATSVHSQQVSSSCQGCHNGAQHPSAAQCATCHSAVGANSASAFVVTCQLCHNGAATDVHGFVAGAEQTGCTPCHGGGDAHKTLAADGCIGCHSIAITNHPGTVVADNNNGVRAITTEFAKWSHHVTGVTLDNAHCAACHLEGKVTRRGEIAVDDTYHMADAMTHLRNADTDANMQWDPAAPNHSTMDNFCMSCHDANGATSPVSQAIQNYINTKGIAAAGKTASATNPFGDTISNRYDKMQRPAVVNVDSQFNTTNNSHHGVKGPRYSGRTRAAGPRQIANPGAFANNSSSTLWGKRSTIYDGVDAISGVTGGPREAFNALYVPLENAGGETAPRTGAQGLGDDSTLHCGDCHTVGQWKPGTAQGYTPTDPATIIAGTSPAIGAHGSNNEYLLRNSKATDERHTQDAFTTAAGVVTLQNPNAAFLVCYNCHSYERYGSIFNATGTTGPHAGEYDASGRCNGVGNTIPFNGYTTGTATDGTQFTSRFMGTRARYSSTPAFAAGYPLNFAKAPGGVQAATYTGEQEPDFGNIFGIQCLNCHNSGLGNGYGGIHGSAKNTVTPLGAPDPSVTGGAFVNGMGNTSKVERFLPGLGNVMHVPGTLGGVTGGTTYGPITNTQVYSITTGGIMNDTNWEQVAWQQVAGQPVTTTARAGAGCYTLGENANGPTFGIEGQPVAGEGSAEVEAIGTWGGCDDHTGSGATNGSGQPGPVRGGGDHGFIKRINRPITY